MRLTAHNVLTAFFLLGSVAAGIVILTSLKSIASDFISHVFHI